MRLFLLAFLCLVLATTRPALADPAALPLLHPSHLRLDILYTHKGEFVQVSPMRPLTLNAHVEQFAYDPLGLEIAYVGSEAQGENTLHFVKTVDTRTGKEISRLTLAAPTGSEQAGFLLLGWSVSGKYLLLQRFTPDPQNPNEAQTEYLRWDLSANPPVAQTIEPESALPPGAVPEDDSSNIGFASSDGRWIAFKQQCHILDASGKQGPQMSASLLYDVERNTFQMLPLPPKTESYFWVDTQHLLVRQDGVRKELNIVTDQLSPFTSFPDRATDTVSKWYPDLSLDTEARDIDDLKDTSGQAASYIVWIRRTPFGKSPFGTATAGVMPRIYDPGYYSYSGSVAYAGTDYPKAAWSPTGKQVAFIANGDLCVTNLVAATDLLPHEKMAVGLKLSCEEERQLAMSNLKQIGLALIQYAQDFDEHFPPTDDIEKTLYPYLKTHDVFSVGSTQWVYHGASSVSLASIDSPADTVQATMDLPCAHLVLYFDGHVKAYPKEPTP